LTWSGQQPVFTPPALQAGVRAVFRFPLRFGTVRLGISVTEALIRLRAHAFSRDCLIADVAQDVIVGRLRLD
jgi:hypothetical protein